MRRLMVVGFTLTFILASCAPAVQYRAVTPGYEWSFPRDHFSHPDFRTEWWYYSGHLDAADGNTYGFELVFFQRHTEGDWRFGLPVWWFANPAHVSHFAVSDIAARRFVYSENLGLRTPLRGGARSDSFHLWSEDWQAIGMGDRHYLVAEMDDYAVEIMLTPSKPPVLHGDNGYSKKGEQGNASYYVSLTRMKAEGWLVKDGKRIRITGGDAWLDHEILSGSIGANLTGWDWFSLQFENGADLMLCLLRKQQGGIDPLSYASYVAPDGSTQKFLAEDFTVVETDHWTSPRTKTRYPVAWQIHIKPLDIKLQVTAPLPFSELITRATRVIYWEGAVEVNGRQAGNPLNGRGYVEMSGRNRPFEEI